ncbi:MAG TPA: hypothetical protein VM571_09700 [Noviherbaspirillum sp.]|nr:hypothetical protein [Noviherbaspirillum sp.]
MSSIKRVTTVVAEIAEASQAQRSGIEEINDVVVRMDEMMQENAALVEQAAAAAQSMHDQAMQLSQAVSVFKRAVRDRETSIP